MSNLPAYLSLPNIARTLRVPYRVAYQLILTGEIIAQKVGGQWHVDPESFIDYLARHGSTDKGQDA